MGTYSILKKMKKKVADDDYIVYYTYRKISTFFSSLFIKLRISANQITVLGLLTDFLAIYLMYAGHWIWAGIIVNLAPILDCSDGEVARYNLFISEKEKS